MHRPVLLPGVSVLGVFLEWALILPSTLNSFCLGSSSSERPQHFALASAEAPVIITVCKSCLQGDRKFLKGGGVSIFESLVIRSSINVFNTLERNLLSEIPQVSVLRLRD